MAGKGIPCAFMPYQLKCAKKGNQMLKKLDVKQLANKAIKVRPAVQLAEKLIKAKSGGIIRRRDYII